MDGALSKQERDTARQAMANGENHSISHTNSPGSLGCCRSRLPPLQTRVLLDQVEANIERQASVQVCIRTMKCPFGPVYRQHFISSTRSLAKTTETERVGKSNELMQKSKLVECSAIATWKVHRSASRPKLTRTGARIVFFLCSVKASPTSQAPRILPPLCKTLKPRGKRFPLF